MENKRSRFDYGAIVRMLKNAPEKYHPSEIGFVVGMIDIDSYETATAYDCIGSDWLYTIELLDGSSLQIPEKYLGPDHKFSWGDTLVIKKTAPSHFHPGELVSVRSVEKIEPQYSGEDPSPEKSHWLYKVDLSDKSSIDVPEYYLEPFIQYKKASELDNPNHIE